MSPFLMEKAEFLQGMYIINTGHARQSNIALFDIFLLQARLLVSLVLIIPSIG